jgi:rhodanese-related sulfurtransferase
MSLEVSAGRDAISVDELASWRQQKTPHVLLDVRESDELAICAVADAIHIPMGEVPARVGELPADIPVVVMCHHGMRSQRVMQYLRSAGRDNAINLEGGIDAWAVRVDPGIGRY